MLCARFLHFAPPPIFFFLPPLFLPKFCWYWPAIANLQFSFFLSLHYTGFHYTPLPHYLPESCLLVIIGFLVGAVAAKAEGLPEALSGGLSSELFFLFLLPPIMLEAGYFMPARAFFANIGTILMYAVIGTLFNTLTIGFSLFGISEGFNVGISLLECLTFSSLISAVDPVAVLAVFEEIHVNEVLHIFSIWRIFT